MDDHKFVSVPICSACEHIHGIEMCRDISEWPSTTSLVTASSTPIPQTEEMTLEAFRFADERTLPAERSQVQVLCMPPNGRRQQATRQHTNMYIAGSWECLNTNHESSTENTSHQDLPLDDITVLTDGALTQRSS